MPKEEFDSDSDVNVEDDEYFEDDSSHSGTRVGDAKKRYHHNLLERKRRNQIKNSFQLLRNSIPSLKGDGKAKTSRAQILKTAAEYIISLNKTHNQTQRQIHYKMKEKIFLEKKIKHLESLDLKKFTNNSSFCSSSVTRENEKGSSRLGSKRIVSSDLSNTKPSIPSSVPSSTKNDNSLWFDTSNVNSFSDLSSVSSEYSDVNSTENDNDPSFLNAKINNDDSSSSDDDSSISKTADDDDSSYSIRHIAASESLSLNSAKMNDDTSLWLASLLNSGADELQNIENWNSIDLGLLNPSPETDNVSSSSLNCSRTFDDTFFSSSSINGIRDGRDGDTCLNKLKVESEEYNFDESTFEFVNNIDDIFENIPIKEESIDIIYNGVSDLEDVLDPPCQPSSKRFRNF